MQTTMLSLPCSFWPGPPPVFPCCKPASAEGNGFVGSLLLLHAGPQRFLHLLPVNGPEIPYISETLLQKKLNYCE